MFMFRYDERFRGYGYDKVLFFYALDEMLRPPFWVLPRGFAIDVPHVRSADWHATYDRVRFTTSKTEYLYIYS